MNFCGAATRYSPARRPRRGRNRLRRPRPGPVRARPESRALGHQRSAIELPTMPPRGASPRRPGGSLTPRIGARHRRRTIPLALVSPKTLTGEELQLDDAPARDSDLPRRRQQPRLPGVLRAARGARDERGCRRTRCWGSRTCSSLLTDYRPKGVAVAWDTRPVERMEQHEGYKADRRPMADLLREQFPYLTHRRGVRVPQPRVRGLGGRRRHRHARHAWTRPG